MDARKDLILRNLESIRARMLAAAVRAGREPESVCLVAVTKYVDADAIRVLVEAGCTHLGENRVEHALPKMEALAGLPVQWHMIGNLQRRKVPQAVANFPFIDAVDRLSLAETIQRRCEQGDCTATILVEVNVSGEAAKHGVTPEELPGLLAEIRRFDRISVRGLMTMAPFEAPEGECRRYFAALRALTLDHGLRDTSMGMTRDFEWAIEEGATEIRVGSALFE